MRSNAQVVRDSIEVVWNRGELDRISELYTDNFVIHPGSHGIFTWPNGPKGVRQIAEDVRKAFPDYHEEPNMVLEDGDLVAVRQTVTGTNTGPGVFRPTGKKFRVFDTMFIRIEDGRLAEQWGLFDRLGQLAQLGLVDLPPHLVAPPATTGS